MQLAPALLAALVATLTLASGSTIAPDARLLGAAVAIVLIARRAPTLAVILVAAAVTAVARQLGMG